MKASDLTTAQRRSVEARIQPTCAYLYDLSRRMQRRGWHSEAPEYVNAVKAHEALVRLSMALHYAGTGHAWEPPEERNPETAPPGTRP